MKQDRFLTAILIGIAVLIVVALVVFFSRKDNLNYVGEDTPEGVVQDYVVALHKRDFQKAYSYLADLTYKPTFDEFRTAIMNRSVDPTNAGLEIGKSEISDDSASVSLGVIYSPNDPFSSGYRNADYAQLVRQNGAWKLKQLPYSFWDPGWYQNYLKPQAPVN